MTRWLEPPRLRTGSGAADEERHATWTELFFDLVFVAAIASLGALLRHDASLDGTLRMAGLFIPVWWAWIGFTLYADRFDSDDAVFRLLMLAGMLASGALAINVHYAAEGSSTGFALSYVAARTLLIVLYDRARRHVPEARPLVNRYMKGFSVSAALWLLSIAFTGTTRYVIWAIAMAIDIGTPVFTPDRIISAIPFHRSHIPERFGLFTLIVLGETVVSVTAASANIQWTVRAALVAAGGFVVVACLWWVYFDLLDLGAVRKRWRATQLYFYGHLPLLIALTAIGAGTKLAIDSATASHLGAGARGLLLGGAAVSLGELATIELAGDGTFRTRGVWARLVAAVALTVLAIAGGGVAPVVLLALVASILVAELVSELLVPAPALTCRTPSFASDGGEIGEVDLERA
jgi:low temperature requirement protein LtrA